MTVDVIIVNYKSGEMLERCLDALSRQTRTHTVQIVDNASGDGSPRRIHQAFPRASILPLRRNVGFGRAVNIAAQRSRCDLIVTLNPDTIPDPQFIERVTEPFNERAEIGSVAGTLLFESNPDIIASAGIDVHRNGVAIDSLLGEHYDPAVAPRPVFGASAGAAAYRRSVFVESGGLAEPFFMYLEDVDLAWRMRLRGYESVWSPGASVLHRYSASAGEGSAFKRRLLARNRLWTLVRCLPGEIWKRDALSILGFDSVAFGYGVATLDWPASTGRIGALAGLLPRIVERDRIQRSVAVDIGTIDAWIKPAVSPRRLRTLRQFTGKLSEMPGRALDHGGKLHT